MIRVTIPIRNEERLIHHHVQIEIRGTCRKMLRDLLS